MIDILSENAPRWKSLQVTSQMKSQNWLWYWLGAIKQQVCNWANVDPVISNHMASLGYKTDVERR